ncbi:MAG: hypothetical protein C5B52_03195 [Bacteroidetes bacterium]|nr:MAG: hypothetical protein C5B52_03195 [Bacteroidota bacterium]
MASPREIKRINRVKEWIQRRIYQRHYIKYVIECYKYRFNHPTVLQIDENIFEVKDISGELKINMAVLEKVIETTEHFYTTLKTGGYLIIPKTKIENPGEMKNLLKRICSKLNIQFVEELNWRWK